MRELFALPSEITTSGCELSQTSHFKGRCIFSESFLQNSFLVLLKELSIPIMLYRMSCLAFIGFDAMKFCERVL